MQQSNRDMEKHATGKRMKHSLLHPNSCIKQNKFAIHGRVMVVHDHRQSGPGKSASLQIYSRTEFDARTGKGKLSEKAYLKQGKCSVSNGVKTTTYKIKFFVEADFGIPGAFVVKNQHHHRFFLKYAFFQTPCDQIIHFECNSWVYPVLKIITDRIFFSNTSYLPNETPTTLSKLRKEELTNLRGDGKGERKEWERIYDYDLYNDLGNPDQGANNSRAVLGGSDSLPYPRRQRTGRPPTNSDPLTESKPKRNGVYVPPDERLNSEKVSKMWTQSFRAAESMFAEYTVSGNSSDELRETLSLSRKEKQEMEQWMREKLLELIPDLTFEEEGVRKDGRKNHSRQRLRSPPRIVREYEWAWKDDMEFGRQMLAGINPARIRCLEWFPPPSKYGAESKIKASHVEHNLDGITLDQAMKEWRMFILDHSDYLMPFLQRINTNYVFAYASRTLFFMRDNETLKPIAIELTLPTPNPNQEASRVYLPPPSRGSEAFALWQLAKTHVLANDSVYHQLISHWLHTHAVVEPFIIATRRQLSVMHPIYRLLDPHFKDTMHVNALFRHVLLSSGGLLEKTLFSGKLSMELSSELYKEWRFDEQALPADLLKRFMAVNAPDPDNPTGVQLIVEDYPYGVDGLEIWATIKAWVKNFCSIFYINDDSVSSDEEIQAWWSEIKNVGHGDKRKETWWNEMNTLSNLTEALTILIWISSALHASVNYGQNAYAGYPMNCPSLCRKFIPDEGTFKYAKFLKDPDKYYLNMLPSRKDMYLGAMLVGFLSQHTAGEVYLGQKPSTGWTDNVEVQKKLNEFKEELVKIEKKIKERNADPNLKNRRGPDQILYDHLCPNTSNDGRQIGSTGRGIPNSISIQCPLTA